MHIIDEVSYRGDISPRFIYPKTYADQSIGGNRGGLDGVGEGTIFRVRAGDVYGKIMIGIRGYVGSRRIYMATFNFLDLGVAGNGSHGRGFKSGDNKENITGRKISGLYNSRYMADDIDEAGIYTRSKANHYESHIRSLMDNTLEYRRGCDVEGSMFGKVGVRFKSLNEFWVMVGTRYIQSHSRANQIFSDPGGILVGIGNETRNDPITLGSVIRKDYMKFSVKYFVYNLGVVGFFLRGRWPEYVNFEVRGMWMRDISVAGIAGSLLRIGEYRRNS